MPREVRSTDDGDKWDVFEEVAEEEIIAARPDDPLVNDAVIAETASDSSSEDLFDDIDTLDFDTDGDLQASEPDPELNLPDEKSNEDAEQPPASVQESDSPEPIIFDEEANQGHPVATGDGQDDSTDQSDDLDVPGLPEPDPSELDSNTTDLPAFGSLPEPPHEVELNPDPPYDFAFELDDDDMGEG